MQPLQAVEHVERKLLAQSSEVWLAVYADEANGFSAVLLCVLCFRCFEYKIKTWREGISFRVKRVTTTNLSNNGFVHIVLGFDQLVEVERSKPKHALLFVLFELLFLV